jgi:hypothetical protein
LSNIASWQWKEDAVNKPAGNDGDAIIGFLGLVSTNGSSLSPDAGWKVKFPIDCIIAVALETKYIYVA